MAIQLDGTTGISTTGNIVADGALVVGSFNPSAINASGNVAGLNLNTNGNLSVGGNAIVTGDLTVVGNASLSGNIVGDKITNGTTSVEIQTPNGNANITIGGTSNVAVFTTTGVNVTGVVSANGNITGGNLNAAGLSLSSNVVSVLNSTSNITTTANITGGNLNAAGLSLSSNVVSALNSTSNITTTANITGGNILGGNLATGGTLSTAGNIVTTGNITNVSSNSFIRFDDYGTFSANITMYQASGNGNIFVRIGESTSEGPGIFGLFSTGTIGAIGNLTSVSNIVQFGNSATWVLAKNVSSTGVITATGGQGWPGVASKTGITKTASGPQTNHADADRSVSCLLGSSALVHGA
jgi:hypothetical protein